MTRELTGSMCSRACSILLLCIIGLPLSAPGQTNQTSREGQLDLVGFPLLSFTSDRGTGYGAYVAGFWRAEQGARVPYKASVGGQFYETTGGYAFHKFLVDIPNLLDSGIRLELDSGYELWDSAWYFGVGNHLPRFSPSDVDERFYTYDSKSLWIVPKLRLPLDGGFWLFTTGLYRQTSIATYRDTLLDSDRPTGVEGGSLSQLQLGLMYDKRDREPDTHRGIFAELSVRFAHHLTGSDYTLFGFNATHRHWVPLMDAGRLTFAYRLGLDYVSGDVPFFHQHILGGSQQVDVGGNVMLRGFPNGRFRGNWTAYNNTELRWRMSRFQLSAKREIQALLVPFVDVGRVWLESETFDLAPVHVSVGTGLRFVYNSVFIMRFDVATATEAFATESAPNKVSNHRQVLGVYAIVNHPF